MNFFLYLMWTITITPHTDTMPSIRVLIDLRATQSFFIHHLLIYWTYLLWLIGIWYIFSHANWEVTFGNTKVLRDDFIMIRDKAYRLYSFEFKRFWHQIDDKFGDLYFGDFSNSELSWVLFWGEYYIYTNTIDPNYESPIFAQEKVPRIIWLMLWAMTKM